MGGVAGYNLVISARVSIYMISSNDQIYLFVT